MTLISIGRVHKMLKKKCKDSGTGGPMRMFTEADPIVLSEIHFYLIRFDFKLTWLFPHTLNRSNTFLSIKHRVISSKWVIFLIYMSVWWAACKLDILTIKAGQPKLCFQKTTKWMESEQEYSRQNKGEFTHKVQFLFYSHKELIPHLHFINSKLYYVWIAQKYFYSSIFLAETHLQ